jgi:hypothetical protein
LALDTLATSLVIEGLSVRVLLQHPQVEPSRWCVIDHRAGAGRQEEATDPPSLHAVGNVEIVKKSTPRWVIVEVRVDKADDFTTAVSDDRPIVGLGPSQARSPKIPSIVEHFNVQKCVGIGAAIVSAPAVRVEGGNLLGVADGGAADLDADAAAYGFLI